MSMVVKTKDGLIEFFDADTWERNERWLNIMTFDGRLNATIDVESIMWYKDEPDFARQKEILARVNKDKDMNVDAAASILRNKSLFRAAVRQLTNGEVDELIANARREDTKEQTSK